MGDKSIEVLDLHIQNHCHFFLHIKLILWVGCPCYTINSLNKPALIHNPSAQIPKALHQHDTTVKTRNFLGTNALIQKNSNYCFRTLWQTFCQNMWVTWVKEPRRVTITRFQDPLQVLWLIGYSWGLKLTNFEAPNKGVYAYLH